MLANAYVPLVFAALLTCSGQAARAADLARGKELYVARCGACHSLTENGAGPRHTGLFGRKAGTQPGFDYSPALKASGIVWNERQLDLWLANPNRLVPGNKMVVQLANVPRDRADIIAFLREATRQERGLTFTRERARPEVAKSPSEP